MDSRLHDEPRPRRADERDDARRPVEPLREVAADHVLALQRSAGNQAVSALLARAPAPAQPKEKAESAGGSGARVTLPGIGTIAVESVGLDAPGAGTGGASAHESVRQIMFTSRQGAHSPALAKAATDGRPMAVTVLLARMRLALEGALVAAYNVTDQMDSPIESWTLECESVRQLAEGDASG